MRRSLDKERYLETLKARGQTSRVYVTHQLTGLILADILEDREHKSLYMKLAKQYRERDLLALAKDIAERKNIKNKGAYFMKMLKNIS